MKAITKLGKWHIGDEQPKESGWYLRDYRNPNKPTNGTLPPFAIDKYECDAYGGFWYVIDCENKTRHPELNGAWFEELPWCKLK